MMVPTASLELVKFGWEVIKEQKSFFEEVESLQKTESNDYKIRKGFDEDLMTLWS